MERASKRPRLSMFADMQPDAELDRARHKNDLLLKSKFEAIFDKYARDFNGVGDVVDLNTGQIVEDNGHLRKMDNEKDAGRPRSRPCKSESKEPASGRSLLRAMTAAPDRDDSYFSDANADDVIQSIETIAENAAISDDGETESLDQSYNDLSGTDAIEHSSRDLTEHDTPLTSDTDSLFEVVDPGRQDHYCDNRASSPDSLFGGGTQQDYTPKPTLYRGPSEAEAEAEAESTPLHDFTETAIYARFGPRVGKKVVDLIEKRDMAELHIDPAWRIPVEAQPRHASSTRSHSTVSYAGSSGSQPGPSAPLLTNPSPIKGKSMWGEGTRRTGSHFVPRAEALCLARVDREESEDPLQAGFYTDQSDSDDEADYARCDKAARQGVCPYCLEQYVDRCAVLQHINREMKYCQRGEERGPHVLDHLEKLMDYIHERAKKKTPGNIRGPRLPVCDFKTMVELHEGAGMTFKEIIDADVLWTLKNDPDLLAFLYFAWRDIEDVTGKDGKPSREWSKKENSTINRLLRSRKVGMDTLRRHLKKRTAVEIGNKLADMWLTELHTSRKLLAQEDEDEEHEEDEEETELPPPTKMASRHRKRPAWSPSSSEDDTDPEYRPGLEERGRTKRKAPRRVVDYGDTPEPSAHTQSGSEDQEAAPGTEKPVQSCDRQTHEVQLIPASVSVSVPISGPATQSAGSADGELSDSVAEPGESAMSKSNPAATSGSAGGDQGLHVPNLRG